MRRARCSLALLRCVPQQVFPSAYRVPLKYLKAFGASSVILFILVCTTASLEPGSSNHTTMATVCVLLL